MTSTRGAPCPAGCSMANWPRRGRPARACPVRPKCPALGAGAPRRDRSRARRRAPTAQRRPARSAAAPRCGGPAPCWTALVTASWAMRSSSRSHVAGQRQRRRPRPPPAPRARRAARLLVSSASQLGPGGRLVGGAVAWRLAGASRRSQTNCRVSSMLSATSCSISFSSRATVSAGAGGLVGGEPLAQAAQVHQRRRHPLQQRIVQLARHPGALGQRGGVARRAAGPRAVGEATAPAPSAASRRQARRTRRSGRSAAPASAPARRRPRSTRRRRCCPGPGSGSARAEVGVVGRPAGAGVDPVGVEALQAVAVLGLARLQQGDGGEVELQRARAGREAVGLARAARGGRRPAPARCAPAAAAVFRRHAPGIDADHAAARWRTAGGRPGSSTRPAGGCG